MDRSRCLCYPVLLIAMLLSAGCAARGPQTWRLVPQDRAQLLVPPRIAAPTVSQSVFVSSAPSWRVGCAPEGDAVTIQKKGKSIRITVARDTLLKQPPGWLGDWTAS